MLLNLMFVGERPQVKFNLLNEIKKIMFLTCWKISSARVELASLFCPQAPAIQTLRIMSNSFLLEQVTSLLQYCNLERPGFFFRLSFP
jgi:hypothetical protein